MAPGGGSISATVGALGVALGTMVANLSSHKAGWDDQWEFFSDWAVKGQHYKNKLLFLVDEDTRAFNKIIDAVRLPKTNEKEKNLRLKAIETATKYATEIPLEIMKTAFESMEVMKAMAFNGMQSSLSDTAVGILCAKTAVVGAYLNVRINAKDIKDEDFSGNIMKTAKSIFDNADEMEKDVMTYINSKL
jgi:glutamate formiminotransferase/formiminotetrahydrofolate cyclodeaminase